MLAEKEITSIKHPEHISQYLILLSSTIESIKIRMHIKFSILAHSRNLSYQTLYTFSNFVIVTFSTCKLAVFKSC